MSRPVPSPSMNGMTGWSGTRNVPLEMVIFSPPTGAFVTGLASDIALLLKNAAAMLACAAGDLSIAQPDINTCEGWLSHARGVRTTFGLLDAVAGAAGQLAPRRQTGAGGICCGRNGDRRKRTGDRRGNSRAVWKRACAIATKDTGRGIDEQRCLDEGLRSDLRDRSQRTPARHRLDLQRLGRS